MKKRTGTQASSKRFQRRVEDFVCEECGKQVKGNGYTDHCPNCLTSKHVDNNPGDRSSTCKALMYPIRTHYKDGVFTIVYKCSGCGRTKEFKAAGNDNEERLFALLNVKK